MTFNEFYFLNNFPKLDLHGMDRDSAVIYIKEFINDNLILKNDVFIIVHGIGGGILKKATHDYLKTNKDVLSFKLNYFNSGCTIVKLKININD